MDSSFPFLELPPELRNKVFKYYFFASCERPVVKFIHITSAMYPPKPIRMRDIQALGYRARFYSLPDTETTQTIEGTKGFVKIPHRKPLPTSIYYTSRVIEQEASAVFYGNAVFDLRTLGSSGNALSYELLQKIASRHRALIRHIIHYSFFESLEGLCIRSHTHFCKRANFDAFDWELFCHFLQHQCPSLQTLELYAHLTSCQGKMISEMTLCDGWVRPLLRLPTLQRFELRSMTEAHVGALSFADHRVVIPVVDENLLRQAISTLKTQMTRPNAPSLSDTAYSATDVRNASFRFTDIPPLVRKQILKHVVLQANEEVHPYIRPWYDAPSRNILPLLLTSHVIFEETKQAFYENAVLTVSTGEHLSNFFSYLQTLTPEDRRLIRRIKVSGDCIFPTYPRGTKNLLFPFIRDELTGLQEFIIAMTEPTVVLCNRRLTPPWNQQGVRYWWNTMGHLTGIWIRFQLGESEVDFNRHVRAWLHHDSERARQAERLVSLRSNVLPDGSMRNPAVITTEIGPGLLQ